MTFGDYEYGPDQPEAESDPDSEEVQTLPPDHPASAVQCDHPNCKNETPEPQQRICDDCTVVMQPETPDRCNYCGASL